MFDFKACMSLRVARCRLKALTLPKAKAVGGLYKDSGRLRVPVLWQTTRAHVDINSICSLERDRG